MQDAPAQQNAPSGSYAQPLNATQLHVPSQAFGSYPQPLNEAHLNVPSQASGSYFQPAQLNVPSQASGSFAQPQLFKEQSPNTPATQSQGYTVAWVYSVVIYNKTLLCAVKIPETNPKDGYLIVPFRDVINKDLVYSHIHFCGGVLPNFSCSLTFDFFDRKSNYA